METEPVFMWVDVDDVEEARDEPWGERVARVRDPSGLLVHLGATIDRGTDVTE